MALTFKRYTYGIDPDEIATDESYDPMANHDWEEICTAAGFDPSDEELGTIALADEWNGHPKGALLVAGLAVEGHSFAVSNEVA